MLEEDLRHIAQHLEQPADPAEAVSCTEGMYEETLAHIVEELKTLLEFVSAAKMIVDLDDALDDLEQNMAETELAGIQDSAAEGIEDDGIKGSNDEAVGKPPLKHQLEAAFDIVDARIKELWEEYNKAKDERRTIRSMFAAYESFHFVGRSRMKGFDAVTVKTNCRSKTQREKSFWMKS